MCAPSGTQALDRQPLNLDDTPDCGDSAHSDVIPQPKRRRWAKYYLNQVSLYRFGIPVGAYFTENISQFVRRKWPLVLPARVKPHEGTLGNPTYGLPMRLCPVQRLEIQKACCC